MDYPVREIFWSLQGEGHFVGYPAVFVRLSGCSLWGSGACRIAKDCDTEPTRMTSRMDAGQIASEARKLGGGIAVLTGGEPTDYDLCPLVAELRDAGMRVHLETSGVREVVGLPLEWITVSPKTADYMWRSGHTLKVVVTPGMAFEDVERIDEGTQFLHRYMQPFTRGGLPVNTDEVIGLLRDERNGGGRWALSTQAHRAWGIR